MQKGLSYFIIYTASLICVSAIIFLSHNSGSAITGADAFSIAASRPLYWVFIIASVVGGFLLVKYLLKENIIDGKVIHLATFAIAAIITAAIFTAPANIKADPVGSGATKEQIENTK